MSLRRVLTALYGYQCTHVTKTCTRLQKCSLKVQLQRYRTGVQRNLDSQNVKHITNTWIKRLKEENVPEAELSVKFITEHVLGKERAQVNVC